MAVPASGGVDPQAAAQTWWSRRFLELLESFGLGSRLDRGREYARAGRVLELEVEPGIVLAKVQGARFTPYRVRIRPRTFSDHQWPRAEKAIAARSLTLARLLSGEMPDDIEEVLAGAKLALLPDSYDELRVTCSCPDGANPCKHAAAVYYMLAERFDADPFALFALRGRTEDELLNSLRARRARATGRTVVSAAPAGAAGAGQERHVAPTKPLADTIEDFWRAGPELDQLQTSPLAAEHADALLRRLGPLSPDLDLAELLAPAYAQLAAGAERRGLTR